MQVQKLPAVAGLIWINAGFRIMFGHFGNMVKILLTYVLGFYLLIWCASGADQLAVALGMPKELLAKAVVYALVIAAPALSIGYMQACRDTLRGDKVTPLHLFGGFIQGRRALVSLLGLGLFQFAAVAVSSAFLPPLPDLKLLQVAAAPGADPDPKLLLPFVAAFLTGIAVQTVVWYAPMLAAWHQMRAAKAIFFSIAACWRNKAAFFMWGVGWVFVMMCVVGFLGAFLQAAGQNNVTQLMVAIVMLLIGGSLYCSIYVTYSSVFVVDGTRAPPA